ncbi:hypothetical protein AVEN_267057-1 [Araneus ventricosus]|uniref:Uncharacterized protein n=1 Tax=Araneus ventricosus TaxID=182803 RepID=A0A4Y1ZSV2_ARAVE|nr:hypothetical protein AVEN_232437-1 [Araneus ventricosus]GBL65131.1 hypothetical protein AVEN_267057-1 [Araneus ventricosus]
MSFTPPPHSLLKPFLKALGYGGYGIYRADERANETAEETEQRRSEDRLRTIARRNNMTAEETEQRRD